MKVPSDDRREMPTICKKHPHLYHEYSKRRKFRNSLLVFGFINLFWLIFRTGTKPSRITYPCQQAALKNLSIVLGSLLPFLSLSAIRLKMQQWFSQGRIILIVILLLAPISGGMVIQSTKSIKEVGLYIESTEASALPKSDIFVVNGREVAHIDDLINLMGSHNFPFYQSNTAGVNQGPEGLLSATDVIVLKINCQWSERGGTNTDLLKELIQTIIDHPDGFTGEIIVADNGQGYGDMDWSNPNAEDKEQSSQDVVNLFSQDYNISTFLWDNIGANLVEEYSTGDTDDGYIVYDIPDLETGIYVSYPKFKTKYGSKVSFKYGLWNGTDYERKIKVINLPVLKSHGNYGVTASLKNYMGVQSQQLANGHETVATGGMGTLMVDYGLPTLNIIDAIWVNANPPPFLSTGPSTDYDEATRVNILLAGVDPVALDYWAAKHVLIPTAELIGYSYTHTIDPDNSRKSGLTEAFGVWLNKTKAELLRGGYNVTSNEQNMNIYANTFPSSTEPRNNNYMWMWIGISGTSVIVLTLIIIMVIKKVKQKNENKKDKSLKK